MSKIISHCNYNINIFFTLDRNAYSSFYNYDYIYSFKFSNHKNTTNKYDISSDNNDNIAGLVKDTLSNDTNLKNVFKIGEWEYSEKEIIYDSVINQYNKILDFDNSQSQPSELFIGQNFITLSLDISKIGSPDKFSFLSRYFCQL